MPRKKKSKYNKTKIELWKCKDCDFEWAYRSMKCPICYCDKFTRIM